MGDLTEMSESNCFYHPDTIAVAKCEDCGKSICSNCIRKFKSKIPSIGESSSNNERILCLKCYSYKEDSKAPLAIILYARAIAAILLSIFIIIIGILIIGQLEKYLDDLKNELPSTNVLDIINLLLILLYASIFFIGPVSCIIIILYNMNKMDKIKDKLS